MCAYTRIFSIDELQRTACLLVMIRIIHIICILFCIGAKPIIVRKIIRNGQPEETSEAKKDTTKLLETKTQKNESIEVETDKKEKPKLKPSIKPKVSLTTHLYIKTYFFRFALLFFVSIEQIWQGRRRRGIEQRRIYCRENFS